MPPDFGPDEGLLDLLLSCTPADFADWVADTKAPPAEVERLLWWLEHWVDYRERPVPMREFIDSREYLDAGDFYYPEVKRCAAEIVEGEYDEALLTGSIGAAKTHCANLVSTYELYSLLCMRSPHVTFGLDPTSEIVLVVQSLGEKQAEVPYRQMKRRVETAPVFRRREFRHDPDLKSRMQFHGGIVVSPMTGEMTSTVGQNVIGGLLDEVGNMSVVQRSLRTRDQSAYDQARMLYESLSRRRKSRFLSKGKLPGMLCLAGSRVHPGDFLHQKIEEARKPGSRIYVYDKRTWDVKPGAFGKERFKVFVGDLNRKPRVLGEAEVAAESEAHLVVEVPTELRSEFEADIVGAVRDIAGYSASTRHPFLMDVDAVVRSFGKVPSVSSLEMVDFRHSVPKLYPGRWEVSARHPRAAHLDLALSGDNAGLAVAHVPRFTVVKRAGGVQEYLPVIRVDMLLAVQPPRGGEIPLERITDLLCGARQHGLPLKWVTADGFQSASSLQVLAGRGFATGLESADKMPQSAYAVLKRALYDGRLELPFHALCQVELLGLEVDPKTGKVDHPVSGCFTGETRIALADGTQPTFRELVQRYGSGAPFYVYSIGPDGLCIEEARNPRVTKVATELVEVELDNFQVVRCTPDHLFMTLGREWVRAENLVPDVRLMPLYRSVELKGGLAGYERAWCPVRGQRVLTHHLAAGAPAEGFVVHHGDENKRNNDPRNLQHVTRGAHYRTHAVQLWESRRSVMRAGFDRYFSDPAAREASRLRISKTWAEGGFGPRRARCAVEGCPNPSNAKGLCGAHYQRMRRERSRQSRSGLQRNHRVLSVRRVQGSEEVYDLTVPRTGNFALASGVFVHNSKDVADALACVVLQLSMQVEVWLHHGLTPADVPSSLAEASSGDRKRAIEGRM